MTVFLSLVWRRATGAAAVKEKVSSPPDVAAVPSTDTHLSDDSWSPPPGPIGTHKSTSTRDITSSFRTEQVGETKMHKSDTIFQTTISSSSSANKMPQTPRTPEGLRPRRAIHKVRQELNLQPFSSTSSNIPVGRSHALALSSSSSSTSFYGSCSTSQRVAESPNLSIGHVRTAVGALVAAATEEEQSFIGVASQNSDIDRSSEVTDKYAMKPISVLPPRNWMNEVEDCDHMTNSINGGEKHYKLGGPSVASDEEHDDNRGFDYQRLNDSLECWTPSRARRAFLSDDDNNTMESADASSIHASPATTNGLKSYQNNQYYSERDIHRQRHEEQSRIQQEEEEDSVNSFSSGVGLVEENAMRNQEAYNFEPIIICHDIKDFTTSNSDDHPANVSGISQSTAPHHESVGEDSRDDYAIHDEHQFYSSPIEEKGIDGVIIRRQGSCQAELKKEQLILELIQRVQGDEQLVTDILRDQNASNILHGEGLLTGYSPAKRQMMMRKIQNILTEMDNTHQEEYFMSPSQIPTFSEAHTGLRKALAFIQSILKTAIRNIERNKISFGGFGKLAAGWTIESPSMDARHRYRSDSIFWLRKNLGIDDKKENPCTPRGGDTSVFSLPSDETATTPHTSNVSMNSSITSKRSYEPSSPSRRETLRLRQTLIIAITVVQRLTLACDKLVTKNPTELIGATEEIKANYLELMVLSKTDLAALLKACLPEVRQFPISRVVSDDTDQDMNFALPPLIPRQHATAIVYPPRASSDKQPDTSSSIMFSPTSDDMNSDILTNDFEVLHISDTMDLKGGIVSFDYQDNLNHKESHREEHPIQSFS
mmetsp:Transcript_17166/g.24153  ORF Transcript_17166/g.24153 Transcript_17166/m.24153 type:complete len:824 (+) Transcript_17166:144-2615(+)